MKIYIETIGCKLNQFESKAIADSFEKMEFSVVGTLEDADCAVVNTCSVTSKADAKSRLVMRRAKKLGKLVIATGCYATTDREELDSEDIADIIVKNDMKFSIPRVLAERLKLQKVLPAAVDEFPLVRQFEQTRASVKVQDGCDKFCSYCKIPHARGRSRSLEPLTAVSFVRDLLGSGYREIVLTGINISDYHFDGKNLYGLVKDILALDGDFRIRLSSLQPDEFDIRLVEFLGNEKFADHFHLSLQSGSTPVLKRMERNYTGDFFLKQAQKIRNAAPGCGISTDIIVGFPGETEKEFEETLALVRAAEFTKVHIFPYSPREHTKAAGMPEIDPAVRKQRVRALEECALKTGMDYVGKNVIGKKLKVLAESPENGVANGHAGNYLKVVTGKIMDRNSFYSVSADSAFVEKDIMVINGSF
jgi:threonylcarbamoyladenosine tRNA methylthiotransferase MtaB